MKRFFILVITAVSLLAEEKPKVTVESLTAELNAEHERAEKWKAYALMQDARAAKTFSALNAALNTCIGQPSQPPVDQPPAK